jgi:hypothetical protein
VKIKNNHLTTAINGGETKVSRLFEVLKERGFNFEDTHMTNSDKLGKLLALFSIAFVWGHKVG